MDYEVGLLECAARNNPQASRSGLLPRPHNVKEEGMKMAQNRIRIVDVADALGLSTATVSKVIFRTWLDSPKNFLTFFQFWVLLFL